MTTADVKSMVQTVVEAHATHNTFYSVWNTVKDRESELTYPCVLWGPWRSRIAETEIGLERTVTVALVVITAMPTDRTPAQRDTAVHQAEQAAAQFILKLREDYPNYRWENVQCSPQFDEYTALETGVVLSFTVSGVVECLDDDAFEPGGGDCPSLAELIEGSTWVTIKAAMSPEQLAAAEADICDIPDPTTVNGTESDTPTITVVQGGVEVGTLNPATGVHTVPECEATPIDVTVNDAEFDTATSSPFDVPVVDGTGTAVGSKVGSSWVVPTAKSLCQLVTEGTAEEVATCVTSSGKRPDVLAELIPTVAEPDTIAQVFDVMKPEQKALLDVTVQLQDGAGNNLGAADVYPATTSTTKTAPDGSVQRRDSAGNTIGSPIAVRSGQTDLGVDCPDGTVTIINPNGDSLGTQAVRSNGTANFTAPIPLKFVWAPGDADTYLWTVTADEAGSYTTFTDNGSVGSLTYSINGGAFNAVTGTVTLVVGQTIVVRRSTTTLEGVARWVL